MRLRSSRVTSAIVLTLGALGCCSVSAAPAFASAPEEPVTKAATAITGTTATLNGELNPHSTSEVGYEFIYNTNGACTEGLATPAQPQATAKELHVAVPVTELEASTSYTFCLVATNTESGATTGPALTFETLASAPVVASESTSGVTPFEAALEAQVNTENEATTYHFEYANNSGLSGATTIGAGSLPGTAGNQTAGPVPIGGLIPNSPYYYRVVATNATGTVDGPTEELLTPESESPTILSASATEVTRTEAVLRAMINPNYQETTYQFRLGTTTSYTLATVPATPGELGGGGFSGELEATVNLKHEALTLAPNTEYHYQVLATNAKGTTEGSDNTFLTQPNPPTVVTRVASAVTPTGATISGTVNPGAVGQDPQDETTYAFQYGHTTSYGNELPITPGAVQESETPVPEATNLQGLEPGASYHYRILATNNTNNTPQTVYGNDQTFTTPSTPPTITPPVLASLTQNSATITATLNPNNLSTHYELQVGATLGALTLTASGTTTSPLPLTLTVNTLTPATTYYYTLTAANLSGTISEAGTFTTAPAPTPPGPLTQPATPPLLPTPTITFPTNTTPPHHETNAQKLQKALKACRRQKPKTKRITCEKHAHKKYPTKK